MKVLMLLTLALSFGAFAKTPASYEVTVNGTDKDACIKELISTVLKSEAPNMTAVVNTIVKKKPSWWYLGKRNLTLTTATGETLTGFIYPDIDTNRSTNTVTCRLLAADCNGTIMFRLLDSTGNRLVEVYAEDDQSQCTEVGPIN